jgi:photosystem I subunit 3
MAAALRASVPQAASGKVTRVSRRAPKVVCAAQKESAQIGTALAAAALAATVGFANVEPAFADVAGLTPCSQSKAYEKVKKKELKVLQKRLKLYEAGSAPALALTATIERTEARFANYAKSGVLCGADGLPHLIADPGLALRYGHAGEVFIPTFGFLYVAGYIGYVGRQYLNLTRDINKEIIIDVPLALDLARRGAGWPLAVVDELKAGTLVEKAENITVSPR